jgi:hypothetical protein
LQNAFMNLDDSGRRGRWMIEGARSTGCRTAAEGRGGGSEPSAGGGHRGSSRGNGIASGSGTMELGHGAARRYEGCSESATWWSIRSCYLARSAARSYFGPISSVALGSRPVTGLRQSDRAAARRFVQCQHTRGRDTLHRGLNLNVHHRVTPIDQLSSCGKTHLIISIPVHPITRRFHHAGKPPIIALSRNRSSKLPGLAFQVSVKRSRSER